MNSDVEEIKSRLNIVDILGEYLRLTKAGANWKALCPFHNEKSPSFMVNEEKQIWRCFGCGKGGDIFSFIMEIEGLEFREVLKNLAERAGVKLASYDPKRAEQKNRTLEILELATKFYEHQLFSGPGKDKILAYLHERGLRDETIKEFRLGYAPRGWRHILNFLTGRGYSADEVNKTGLLVKKEDASYYDRFRDRVMFPISDYSGKIVGYSARMAPGGDESQAKYVNTPETEVYHKSRALYGLNLAKQEMKQRDSVLLVEGNMDVISAYQAGIKNTVAISGTALTSEQVDILKRYTSNVAMCFDMDKAGELATKKSLKLCFSKDVHVKVVTLPEGKDAAELAKDTPEKLLKAVEKSSPAMEYLFKSTTSKHDAREAEGKRKITDELLEMMASLASEIEKSHWVKKLGGLLDVGERALTDILRNVTLKKERISSRAESPEEKPAYAPKDKLKVLTDELIGTALAFPEVWRLAVSEQKKLAFLEDRLLALMLEEGERSKFDFSVFVKRLTHPEDISRADNLYFEKRYRLDIKNNLEEVVFSNPEETLGIIMREIRKEQKRHELEKMTKDLKLAEKRHDKNAARILLEESRRITEELSKL